MQLEYHEDDWKVTAVPHMAEREVVHAASDIWQHLTVFIPNTDASVRIAMTKIGSVLMTINCCHLMTIEGWNIWFSFHLHIPFPFRCLVLLIPTVFQDVLNTSLFSTRDIHVPLEQSNWRWNRVFIMQNHSARNVPVALKITLVSQ